ncbi:LOW QUALITY PROTEIN: sterol O-acyltransferase 2-like [Myxocyprinus asiaticus]|uniref:LOW QUALITY PROTEIN: sterol O-acyltransferase 2-like n=1 Tax=Myxocyprinus asiaticus TaxID=70543 RepID=UPI002221E09E|nr:LOW QUALITY PROTEIN: sterol O-acyltransferase 2-like [Myxocyprinus asiaticus]
MATYDTSNSVVHRTSARTSGDNQPPSENGHDNFTNMRDMTQRREDMKRIKAEVIRHVKNHLNEVLDRSLSDSLQSFSQNTQTHTDEKRHCSNRHKLEQGKVFVARWSLLDELFEISHIRTIYHMFIAALFLFVMSTLAVDYVDQGRLVLDFDLFVYAFGQLSTVIWAWLLMFIYTLLGPYHVVSVWGGLYHSVRWRASVSVVSALMLCAAQLSMLGIFPVYVVLHFQLPPASRFIIILEQIRFVMKSYSFIRETIPAVLNNTPLNGEQLHYPSLSSYLYFLFCPTLIYREVYPRNPNVRWNYVGMNFLKILGSLFYLYFILVRLCIPVFMNKSNQPFSTRTLILALFHAAFPGMLMLLLGFYAFLHCWLNAFAEMLRFADRMFYKDWWNSTSFANYYRTWNIVVHDWLYFYGYRDFLRLSSQKFRSVATLSVFAVSALVHEYAFTLGFGFFYPVMFCTFAGIGVVFNFAMNDKRKSPVWNIIMWTCLFIGQGVHVGLYCLEWYAQIHCPRTGTSFRELVTPRSWTCNYQ